LTPTTELEGFVNVFLFQIFYEKPCRRRLVENDATPKN
jgi:hypothetical protein